ncbi:MAG: aminotransferase class I/II-fold pyridoxal phosphate-dependent enzyme, partial [Alphaproteobacteria bacterium]|nr:aminotransferase class I/II-fold pyridoxal phosphate-dependent enzyme [Alphaproteobacteria bacterium]
CSPNNPTGTSFPHDQIAEICREVEGQAVVILDETYAEFSSQGSMTARLADHPNLIILRTLSKSYSMAGMRMGCFISGDTNFIALVKAKALDAYPLPQASVEAALHALSGDIRPIAKANIEKLIAERERLIPLLSGNPLVRHIYPSDANFLLIEMEKAGEFIKFATQNNVVIRDFSTKPYTEDCIRLSIGTPEQNNLVLKLLNDFAP